MLHISRQTDYGLRLMVEIASNGCGPIATIEVARRQDIPYQFLRKVAQSLVAAGLLVSERGTGGGLSLARPADSVTMFDIVDSLETIAFNDCTVDPPRCDRRDRCAVFPVWARMQALVEGLLGSITLSELAKDQARLSLVRKATTAMTAAADWPARHTPEVDEMPDKGSKRRRLKPTRRDSPKALRSSNDQHRRKVMRPS